jgi:hypothetical protein
MKTIQGIALVALFIIIVIGTIIGDFDAAETIAYTFIFIGLAAVHLTTEDNI